MCSPVLCSAVQGCAILCRAMGYDAGMAPLIQSAPAPLQAVLLDAVRDAGSGGAPRLPRVLAEIEGEVAPYARAFANWRNGAETTSLLLEAEVDGVRVHGRLGEAYPDGIVRLRFGKPSGPSSLRNGLDWLLASAAGVDLPFVEFHEAPDAGIGSPRVTAP